MQQSCGNGSFCHAPAAEGGDRFGVPKGLDFDVRPACTDGESCSDDEVVRLREDQRRTFNFRHSIAEVVDNGSMPPGKAGRQARESAPDFRRGPSPDAEALPEVDSPEGQEILENWLACGAPVVERTLEPSQGGPRPGEVCNGRSGVSVQVGECIVRGGSPPPEPNWASIYERVIGPQCGEACHGPGGLDQREESGLDLSEMELARNELVSSEADGEDCMGEGTLVVPGEPDSSLLVRKLEVPDDDPMQCGSRMPTGGPFLSQEVVDVIRQWIADGAP
jgi:hypothetical protein